MAMGVSSYSRKRATGRRAPGESPEPPPSPPELLAHGWKLLVRAWPLLRIPVSLLAVAHLVLLALFPGGRNALFGVAAGEVPAYLTLFQVGDSLGFATTQGSRGAVKGKVVKTNILEKAQAGLNLLQNLVGYHLLPLGKDSLVTISTKSRHPLQHLSN